MKSLYCSILSSCAFVIFGSMNALSEDAKACSTHQKMQEAVSSLNIIHGHINENAAFFIYLQSASWCAPCRAEMPHFVKMYPEMQKMGVELILVSADKSPELGVKFATDNQATFPVVMSSDSSVLSLPHFTRGGYIPKATFVTSSGELIKTGSGDIIHQWKSITGLE